MDSNPQPHQQPDDIGPPLLKFTDLQKQIIKAKLEQAVGNLLSIQFNEPANDALKLRQHSFCYGVVETLQGLINYDDHALAEFEDKMRKPATDFRSDF